MPSLSEIFNRIRNRIFGNSKTPQLTSKKNYELKTYFRPKILAHFDEPLNYNDYCIEFYRHGDNLASQYDYLDLINEMEQRGYLEDFRTQRSLVYDNEELYMSSPVHGIEHTERVVFYTEMLCMLDGISNQEKDLILTAARLHDIGRGNDAKDTAHGLVSVQKIEQQNLLKSYSLREQNIIKFAIASHSAKEEEIADMLKQMPRQDRKKCQKVLNYLQDADKLDRTRIKNKEWALDPKRLSSNSAKRLVKFAHQNYFEYGSVVNYIYQKEYDSTEKTKAGETVTKCFEDLQNIGCNISFFEFQKIVAEFKEGTLEYLLSQGKISDIFSYETFKKFGKQESFDEKIQNLNPINPDELYLEVSRNARKTTLLRGTFDSDFMLYYYLKKNNPQGFDILCHVDLDMNVWKIAGIADVVTFDDIEKLHSQGIFLRMNDLFRLAKDLTPEEYMRMRNSGDIESLFGAKYVKDEQEIVKLRNELQSHGIFIDESAFQANFKLIQTIMEINPQILKEPRAKDYNYVQIYCALTKLEDSKGRIVNGRINNFEYDEKTVLDLVEYSNQTRRFEQISEEEQLQAVNIFVNYREIFERLSYIETLLKKNKPYKTTDPYDMIYYIEFCSDKILADPEITLEDAKSNMIHAMFNIDMPPKYYKKFEKEFLECLYFHKKYIPDSELENPKPYDTLGVLRALFESKNIKDFKSILEENKDELKYHNTSYLMNRMRAEIAQVSKKDITEKLQETSEMLENMEGQFVTTSTGKVVKAKILDGQDFYIATTTVMPRSGGLIQKVREKHNNNVQETNKEILAIMRQKKVARTEVCTTINSPEGLGNAGAALEEHELRYGYIPNNPRNITLMSTNDMSTLRDSKGNRYSAMPSVNRTAHDFVIGTTEEHNEVDMRGLYPRYIFCYDQISDLAMEKQTELEEMYKELGIKQKVEIVLIKAKDKYIPKIKQKVQDEHDCIRQKLANNEFSEEDFENMFEKHESNFLIRTLNSIHTMSYRENVLDKKFVVDILESYGDIIEKVSEIVTPEKARTVLNQVNMMLERADRSNKDGYGGRFYDYDYSRFIPQSKLYGIQGRLVNKVMAYEQCEEIADTIIEETGVEVGEDSFPSAH